METGLKNYIKNMFAMNGAPTWDSSYEGTIFYDKVTKSWITGNNNGWQRLDRSTTSVAPFTAIDWVDPFEYPTDDSIRTNYIVNDIGAMPRALTAKSVIFDIADNWGGDDSIMCREIDFYIGSTKLALTDTDYVVYGSAYSPSYAVANLFNTATSVIGSHIGNGWQQNISSNTRVIVVFNTPQQFDNIIVTNHHDNGANPDYGIQNVKITITTATETLLTYNTTVTGGVVIFDDVFNQHSAVNEPDSQTLVLQNIPEAITTFNIYSENSNITYGDYSLKGTAISGSLGSSITKELIPEINLIGKDLLAFDIASSRVGTNLDIELSSGIKYIKTVVFDIADNWGDVDWFSIRSIEFKLDGELIDMPSTNFVAYATNEYNANYLAGNAFDTSLSKTGVNTNNAWLTYQATTNQRLICVFNVLTKFDSIVINNGWATAAAGVDIDRGVKNIKIYASSEDVSSTVYDEVIPNSVTLFSGIIEQHAAANEIDDNTLLLMGIDTTISHPINITASGTFQTETWNITTESGTYSSLSFSVINDDLENTFYIDNMRFEEKELEVINWIDSMEYPTNEILRSNYISSAISQVTAKSVILDIADQYDNASYVGLRQIEFFNNNELISLEEGTDFIAYESSKYDTTRWAKFAFDTSTNKIGEASNNAWLSANGSKTNQRIICVFTVPQTFDAVIINNAHGSNTVGGSYPDRGAKNVKIYISTDEITSTIYEESITNATLIFNSVFDIHTSVNEVDDQELVLQNIRPLELYSENTIKTFGDYSLKSIAMIDSSVNEFFSKILTPTLDVTDINNIQFDVRSSRVGTNIQLQLSNSIEYSAKSIILEYSDNWGDDTYSQIRSIEFYYKGTLVSLTNSTDFTAYGLFYAVSTEVWRIFDTSLSKTGVSTNNGWVSTSGGSSNRRLVCVFNSSQTFDSIVVNNGHYYGTTNTTRGIKTTKITISDDEITNTTYEAIIANSTVIFDGIIEQHVAIDQIDDQVIPINAGISESILTHDINIQASDVFQTEVWDVTTLSGGYNTLTFKILNDDLENTFYIDNMTKY